MATVEKNDLVGPFAVAEKSLQEFAANIFISFVVAESMEKFIKMNDEYEEAVANCDEEQQKVLKLRLEASEFSLQVAAQMLYSDETLMV